MTTQDRGAAHRVARAGKTHWRMQQSRPKRKKRQTERKTRGKSTGASVVLLVFPLCRRRLIALFFLGALPRLLVCLLTLRRLRKARPLVLLFFRNRCRNGPRRIAEVASACGGPVSTRRDATKRRFRQARQSKKRITIKTNGKTILFLLFYSFFKTFIVWLFFLALAGFVNYQKKGEKKSTHFYYSRFFFSQRAPSRFLNRLVCPWKKVEGHA